MDNQQIDIVSEGRDGIRHALSIIWNSAAPGGKATHYKVLKLREETKYYCRDDNGKHRTQHCTKLVKDEERGADTLILLWHDEDGSIPLPFPLSLDQAAGFVADWIGSASYGSEPDHDGSNGRGWRLFTEAWGHVARHHCAIVGAQPAWAMYGK